MLKTHSTALTAVLIILAAGVFGNGKAQAAAIYTGTFDPRGDVYGFAGTHQFAVDDSCLVSTGWKHVNGYSGAISPVNPALYPSCGNVFLTGGTLTLRKYAAPGTGEDGQRAIPDKTFEFSEAANDWNPALDWGSGVGGMQYYIRSIFVEFNALTGRNELAGVDTPELFGSFGPFDGLNWAMHWVSGQRPADAFGGTGGPAGVYLLGACDRPFTGQCQGVQDVIPVAGVTYTRVPEPGSFALVAAALMAAGLRARRG